MQGFAIHGTNQVRHLGSPASHGCVRLAPQNATRLFNLMRAEGGTITISGSPRSASGERRGKCGRSAEGRRALVHPRTVSVSSQGKAAIAQCSLSRLTAD
ncbi:MAG TPA: L,D-transpeptidase [Beijerinckiaceae bacterium]|nr:L,D-transpeptidase [Beijerinckiaceae bacterium]